MFSNRIHLPLFATGAALLALTVSSFATSTMNRPPDFLSPSPCGQILVANVDNVFGFDISAIATNGLPQDAVVLTVTGDPVPLASGSFTPPMPVGPAQPANAHFSWTPSAIDVGTWHMHIVATDQLGQTTSCVVTIQVPPPIFLNMCMPTEDGTMACPCGVRGSTGHGCENSAGTGGALLTAAGVASLSSDTLHFTASGELPTAFSILLQGQGPATTGVQFGQGVRCFNNNLKRLYTHAAAVGIVTYPQGADLPVSTQSASKGDGLGIGAVRYYLSYYRDPNVLGGCDASLTFNASQGMKVTWVP